MIQNKENSKKALALRFLTVLKHVSQFFWLLMLSFIGVFYKQKKSIKNEVALVTGAAGYLGRQLATEFAKHGATVICWDFNLDENEKTCEHIRSLGYQNVHAYKVDLTNEKDVRENAAKVKDKHGFVSIILLAAAVACETKSIFSPFDSNKLIKSFKLFYESHLWIYQEFLPKMFEKNHGHLTVISSESVFTKIAFLQQYASFKCSQTKLLECVDAELNHASDNKIKTTIIYLGTLKKGISTAVMEQFYGKEIAGENLLDKIGTTNEYAAKQIVNSILENKKYVYFPKYVYMLTFIKFVLPNFILDMLSVNIQNPELFPFTRENISKKLNKIKFNNL